MNEDFIGTYAMKQNQYEELLEHYTLRGYQKIDEPLKTTTGDNTTLPPPTPLF